MSLLAPKVSNGKLTMAAVLNNPSAVQQHVRKLTEEQTLVGKFFSPFAGPLEGGGLLFNKTRLADLTLDGEPEERSPGAEYKQTRAVDPEPDIANVSDWGTSVYILEEELRRGQSDYLQRVTQQVANTLTFQLDKLALAALTAATASEQVPGSDWDNLVFVGPADALTPSAERPTADLSAAQLMADMQGLEVRHDTLVVHPAQAHALRTAYGPDLTGALASAGITEMHVNRLVTRGTAWVVQRGEVGYVGYEEPLTVRTVEHANRRTVELVCYVVPAFAVSNPAACKLLTGLGED